MQLNTLGWSPRQGWSVPLPELEGREPLLLVFGGRADAVRPGLDELAARYRNATLCGCSSAGEIIGGQINDDSLSVAALQFAHSRHRAVWGKVSSPADSEALGRDLGAQLRTPDLRGVLVLSDGTHVNGSALVNGLREAVPPGVLITGGLAGDGPRFGQTWVLQNGVPSAPIVCAIGLYGERLALSYGSGGGWDVFGPERAITKSVDNVLYELDGKPALELYKTYLGERASELPASALLFPLSIRPEGAEHCVVRTVLSVDEAARTMTFAGDVPQGYRAQLMRANLERLIEGAEDAAVELQGNRQVGSSTLAIAISCVGRRLVLGERAEEEVEASLAELPPGTQQVGFYSYGEISPSGVAGCDLHNQTMTLTTISEL